MGLQIICTLGDMRHSETPDNESLLRIARFYEIEARFWKQSNRNCMRVFGRVFDMLSEFSNAANILVVIPAASCSAKRGLFSALRRMKTYLRNNIWGNSVSVTSR